MRTCAIILLALSATFMGAVSAHAGEPAPADVGFDLYGFIKLDTSYATSRTSTGDFQRWVDAHALDSHDPQLNMTANQTRLGFKVAGPADPDYRLCGKLEMDFYGGGAENKPLPYMRHAFVKMGFPGAGVDVIAGQTWDVVSPLNPKTVNYTVQWWAGNVGYRRPQLRVTKGFKLGSSSLSIAGAVLRNIGHPVSDDAGGRLDPGDSGEDSALPMLQGRLGFAFPLGGKAKSAVGVSGHWAREEIDTDARDTHEAVDSWSGHVDLDLHLSSVIGIKGEAWMGQNLDSILGGVGQGLSGLDPIKARGGWSALSLGPWGGVSFNLGGSVDDPDDDKLPVGGRARNLGAFANLFVDLLPRTTLGLEGALLQTDYKTDEGTQGADGFAVTVSLMFAL